MLGLIIFFGIFLGPLGLLTTGSGVSGIVRKQLELSDESGNTTTLTGLSAVLVGSVFTVSGIGMLLLIPVIAVGG